MGTEAISLALRLELRPGGWILWDTRPHRFESPRRIVLAAAMPRSQTHGDPGQGTPWKLPRSHIGAHWNGVTPLMPL